MPMTRDEVFEKVRGIMVDALGADEKDVKPQSRIRADLGAESIDFLDIVFQLEKGFEIKIPRGELFPDSVLNNPEYVANGKVTPSGLVMLKERMPHADFADFEKDPDVNKMFDLFTVQTIVNYVSTKVGAQ